MINPLQADLLQYLRYLKEQGVSHLPVSAPLSPREPKQAPPASAPGNTPAAAPQRPAPPAPPRPAKPAAFAKQAAPPTPSAAPAPCPVPPDSPLYPIAQEIAACTLCPLHATRTNTVPGQGALQPDIMFIGEGPGADEDAQGLSFVGRSGQLLTKMIEAMGYTRDTVFIGNIVKCRPPGNRAPTPVEMAGCIPYLKRQIAIIQPKIIVCLGATAAKGLVNETMPIGKARGQWREFEGIPVMLTFHPAYLLRDGRQKKPAWDDLKAVLAKLGKSPP